MEEVDGGSGALLVTESASSPDVATRSVCIHLQLWSQCLQFYGPFKWSISQYTHLVFRFQRMYAQRVVVYVSLCIKYFDFEEKLVECAVLRWLVH